MPKRVIWQRLGFRKTVGLRRTTLTMGAIEASPATDVLTNQERRHQMVFQYFTLRNLKHQTRNGEEFVSFVADGQAVVILSSLLRVVLLGLKRYALSEVRKYDGRPAGELPTRIDRLEIQDVPQQMARPAPRLVK